MEKEKRVFKMATTESKGDKALKAEDFSEAFYRYVQKEDIKGLISLLDLVSAETRGWELKVKESGLKEDKEHANKSRENANSVLKEIAKFDVSISGIEKLKNIENLVYLAKISNEKSEQLKHDKDEEGAEKLKIYADAYLAKATRISKRLDN